MPPILPYLSSPAASISYAPAAYVRLEWQAFAASPEELKTVYEHALNAMRRHGAPALMSVHNQRPPIPPAIQIWLTTNWIPRAVAEAGYRRCAIVEAATPLGRLSSRAIGAALTSPLDFQYFLSEAEAATWLFS